MEVDFYRQSKTGIYEQNLILNFLKMHFSLIDFPCKHENVRERF